MVSKVRPGEGGIYDNAKVLISGRYRDRVAGIVEKVEDGHRTCGWRKKEKLCFVHICSDEPCLHPMDNVVDASLDFGVQGGVSWGGSEETGIIRKQRNIGNCIGKIINVCEKEQGT